MVSEVDKTELVMTLAGVGVLLLNVFIGYRLSVKYHQERIHAVFNWALLLLLGQLVIITTLFAFLSKVNHSAAFLMAIFAITLMVTFYFLLTITIFINTVWFAFHYRALLRIRATRKAKGL